MHPDYLNLPKKELNRRIEKLFKILDYNPPTASSHFSLRSQWAPIARFIREDQEDYVSKLFKPF